MSDKQENIGLTDISSQYCAECDRKFKTKSSFILHMEKHLTAEIYQCEHCEFIVHTKDALTEHRTTVHGIKIKQCNICADICMDEDSFAAHIRDAHSRKQSAGIMCDKCGKLFVSKQSMKYHMSSKCGTEKQFKCDQCGQRYMTNLSLAAHKVIHDGLKSFSCSCCNKKFISPGELKVHTRMHTKEKPFQCNVCHKAFPYRESLVTHASVHTGLKPYLCTNCEKTFSCIGNLIKHRKTKPNSCGLPQFCQETKLIAPRTKTKMPNNTRNSESSMSSTTEVCNRFQIEMLDPHAETCVPEVEATSLKGADLEIAPEKHKTLNNADTIVLTEEEDKLYTDCINIKNHIHERKTHSPEVKEISPTDSIDYDEELDQYAVELLADIDNNYEEDITISFGETHLPNNSSDNVCQPVDAEDGGNTTKLEIKLDPDAFIESDMDYNEIQPVDDCEPSKLLMEHLVAAHNNINSEAETPAERKRLRILVCPRCDEVFRMQRLYDAHLKSHERSESHIQNRKIKMTATKTKDRILASRYSSNHVCPKCGKSCFSRSVLLQHENSDCGKSPQYQCKDCNQFYHSLSSLTRHSTVHTGELPFLCQNCGKAFRTKGQYVVHMRKHTGEKPFKCHICSKAFPYRQSLVTHITTHTGEKPFHCDCGKSFSCVKNLLSHRRTYSSTCGKLPLNTKPKIQIGVVRGELYIGEKSN